MTPGLVMEAFFNTQISLEKSSEKWNWSTFKAKPSRLGGAPYWWDKLRLSQEEDKDYEKQNRLVVNDTKKILEYTIDIVNKGK